MRYTIYTDGGCSGNKRDAGCSGGFGFIIIDESGAIVLEDGGRIENTTNNRMEMTAVINGAISLIRILKQLQQSPSKYSVVVCTDSQYVACNFEDYLPEWKERGWRKGNGQPVLNKDLWKQLDELIPEFQSFGFRWVKGHAEDAMNNRADAIVRKHIYG